MMRFFAILNFKNHLRVLWLWIWNQTRTSFRRVIVLSSLHATLIKCSVDDLTMLDEVNAEFNLVRDVKVLRFPTLFAPLIWRNLAALQEKDTATVNEEVSSIVRNLPGWLQYGSLEELENDFRWMVKYCFSRYQKS